MSYRTQLRNALAEIIVRLPTPIVPTATITAPIAPGATTFSVGSTALAKLFRKSGTASFWDGTAEFPVLVTDNTGTTVTVKFDGRYDASGNPITGFQYAHSTGALVATNILLVPGNPRDASTVTDMLGNGYPVVRVFAPDMLTHYSAGQQTQPVGMASVVYQLPLRQMKKPDLQTELWLLQQTDRADRDMGLIIDALVTNYTLAVRGTSNADFAEQFRQAGRQNHLTDNLPLYEDYLDIQILGLENDLS